MDIAAPVATAVASYVPDGFYGSSPSFDHAIWPAATLELADLVPSLPKPPPHKHENVGERCPSRAEHDQSEHDELAT